MGEVIKKGLGVVAWVKGRRRRERRRVGVCLLLILLGVDKGGPRARGNRWWWLMR